MATLDTFFTKLRHSAKVVSPDGIETSTCTADSTRSELIVQTETRKRTTTSQEEQQQKRSRHETSSNRLKTKKKSRIIADDSEHEVNGSETRQQIGNHDVPIKDTKPAPDISDPSHRVLREISYEDFLLANSISCNHDTEKQNHADGNWVSKAVLQLTDESICFNGDEGKIPLVSDPLVSDTQDAALCSEFQKDEDMVVSPVNTVVSKDIRSFFSKSTSSIANQKDKKNCATLVKIKAQIHHDPSLQVPITFNKLLINNNCHSELARWQRSNIVITNADLDIEVIEESVLDEIEVADQGHVVNIDTCSKKDAAPEQGGTSQGNTAINCSVIDLCSQDEKSRNSTKFHSSDVTSEQSKPVKEMVDTDCVEKNGQREKYSNKPRDTKTKKKTCVVKPKSDVASSECSLKLMTTIDIADELSVGKTGNCSHQDSDLNEEISRQNPELTEDINPSVDHSPSKEKKSVSSLACSPSKLADIFTPRSRRLANEEQPDVVCVDVNSSQDCDARPARRQSSRLCAKAAMDAIARTEEKTTRVRVKKAFSSSDDDSDVEVVDFETQHEKTKSSSKGGNKDAKLAPIFQKRSTAKASKSPVLSAAEIEARRVRREFLVSGIPEELKRQQEANLALAFCPVSAALPTDSHVQQRVSYRESNLDPWNLPEAELVLRLSGVPGVSSIPSTCGNLLQGGLPSVGDKIVRQEFEVYDEFSPEAKSLLIAEIKSHNPQFPVDRFYNHLVTKRTEVDPPGVKNVTRECSSGKKPRATVVQQVSFKEDLDLDDASDNMLWTDKYAPQCATEIMGNWSSSKKLRDWLTQWKERIARSMEKSTDAKCSRRKKNGTSVTDSVTKDNDFSDYSIESYDSDVNTDENYLCNAMVLYGPHGVGKTSMVYAIASELAFKIFEVNSSGQRDGKHVLTQLQEATQSHQVSMSTSSANSAESERLLSAKAAEPENATRSKNTKRHHAEQPPRVKEKHRANKVASSCDKKSNTVERPFASIFAKVNHAQNTTSSTKKKDQNKPEVKTPKGQTILGTNPAPKKEEILDTQNTSDGARKSKNIAKISSTEKTEMKRSESDDKTVSFCDNVKTSLILFEEVDVVLSEDRGFWNAIETFMSITKRPIVLTASDPQFIDRFSGRFESIKLHTPQLVNTASFLQTICLVENVRTSYADLLSLVSLMHGDVRKAMLLLQSWVQTGASGHHRTPAPIYAFAEDKKVLPERNSSSVPQNAAPHLATSVSANEIATSACHLQIIADAASDEEFAEVRSSKRRRLRRIDSSEEDSSLTVAKPDELILNVDECSQESHTSQMTFGFETAAFEPPTVALSAERAPPIHRVSKDFIEGYNTGHALLCGGEAFRQPTWVSDCWWPEISTFDTALQSDSFLQPASRDSELTLPSVKSMFAVYDYFSSVDCCYSHCSDLSTGDGLLQPGNTDCLPKDDFRNASLKHQQDVKEMQSTLSELLRKVMVNRWPGDYEGGDDDQAHRCLRQEVSKYEKLSLDVRLAGDFVQFRNLGLQRRALSVDIMPVLRTIAKSEDFRRSTNSKRRFYHYLTSLFPDIKESVMSVLRRDFC